MSQTVTSQTSQSLQLKVQQSTLLQHLQLLTSILPAKPVDAVLHYVKITPTKGGVKLTTTNYDISLITQLPIEGMNNGNDQRIDLDPVLVHALKMRDLVGDMYDQDLIITVNGANGAFIKHANGNCKIPTMDIINAPGIDELVATSVNNASVNPEQQTLIKQLTIPLINIGQMIAHIESGLSENDDAQRGLMLTSMLLEYQQNTQDLHLVTADGMKLSWANKSNIDLKQPADFSFNLLIPRTGIKTIKQLAMQVGTVLPITAQLQIRANNNLMEFTITNGIDYTFGTMRRIIVRGVEGKFPNWRMIPRSISTRPAKTTTELICNRELMASALKRLMRFTADSGDNASVVAEIITVPLETNPSETKKQLYLKCEALTGGFGEELLGLRDGSIIDETSPYTQKFSVQTKFLAAITNVLQSEYIKLTLAKPIREGGAMEMLEVLPVIDVISDSPELKKYSFNFVHCIAGTNVAYKVPQTEEEKLTAQRERETEKENEQALDNDGDTTEKKTKKRTAKK